MSMPVRCALVALALAAGCKSDPLAAERAQCEALVKTGELRPGLSVDECAKQLKASDPALRAGALVERMQILLAAGKAGTQTPAQRQELAEALVELRGLGRPGVPPALALLKSSGDAEVRLALARVLVAVCSEDCLRKRWDCIVPAMLEGAAADKDEVRLGALQGLGRCTGEPYGEDLAAWRAWYGAQTVAIRK